MSLRIKAVVDKFVKELKEALDADIQDRIMKEREMQCYIEEREREVAEREAAWKAQLSRREGIWGDMDIKWEGNASNLHCGRERCSPDPFSLYFKESMGLILPFKLDKDQKQ